MSVKDTDRAQPISNPFYGYRPEAKSSLSPMILRSKKGDRSVEVEIPGDTQELSDFVLPISPEFKGSHVQGTGTGPSEPNSSPMLESMSDHPSTPSDREITGKFSQGSPGDEMKRNEIEKGLNLVPAEDPTSTQGRQSYLASMDHIKQLYRNSRYEAALIATDDMIQLFQTDPQLHEMRGTLLDRLGQKELALKSWNQALKLEPQNDSLRKFIDQKQVRSTARTP
jgi:tetratricopeptide (TPR) repeat protein